jgi:hypothetical protein
LLLCQLTPTIIDSARDLQYCSYLMWHQLEAVPSAAIDIPIDTLHPDSPITACSLNDAEFTFNLPAGCTPEDANAYTLRLLGYNDLAIGKILLQDPGQEKWTYSKAGSAAVSRAAIAIDPTCRKPEIAARSIYPALALGIISVTKYSSQFVSPLYANEVKTLRAAVLSPSNKELVDVTGYTNGVVRYSMAIAARKLNTTGRAATILMAYLHDGKFDLPNPADYKAPEK